MDFVKSFFSLCQNEEKIVQPFHSVTTKAFVQASGFAWHKKCSCQAPHSELLFPTLLAWAHNPSLLHKDEGAWILSLHRDTAWMGLWCGEQTADGPWGKGRRIPRLAVSSAEEDPFQSSWACPCPFPVPPVTSTSILEHVLQQDAKLSECLKEIRTSHTILKNPSWLHWNHYAKLSTYPPNKHTCEQKLKNGKYRYFWHVFHHVC